MFCHRVLALWIQIEGMPLTQGKKMGELLRSSKYRGECKTSAKMQICHREAAI
jgi:hypothetical protein